MNLKSQRRLAAAVLGVGVNKIWIDPETADEVEIAITRQEIRKLINEGAIKKLPERSLSRGRAREHIDFVSGNTDLCREFRKFLDRMVVASSLPTIYWVYACRIFRTKCQNSTQGFRLCLHHGIGKNCIGRSIRGIEG